ncbi:MAG: hypothetical protein ACI8PW_000847 [Methylophilaceae bacterium]|jgi:hypothetical protein
MDVDDCYRFTWFSCRIFYIKVTALIGESLAALSAVLIRNTHTIITGFSEKDEASLRDGMI